jgi:hypothetical protein
MTRQQIATVLAHPDWIWVSPHQPEARARTAVVFRPPLPAFQVDVSQLGVMARTVEDYDRKVDDRKMSVCHGRIANQVGSPSPEHIGVEWDFKTESVHSEQISAKACERCSSRRNSRARDASFKFEQEVAEETEIARIDRLCCLRSLLFKTLLSPVLLSLVGSVARTVAANRLIARPTACARR